MSKNTWCAVAHGAENLEKVLFRSWWSRHLSSLRLDEDTFFCAQKAEGYHETVPKMGDEVIAIA